MTGKWRSTVSGRDSVIEADALIARGNALEDELNFESALSFYQQAVDIAPGYARAHLNLGNALQKLGRTEKAIRATSEATRYSPDFAPARFNLGALLATSGDHAGAERELRLAMKLDPTLVDAAVVLADVFEATGRLGDAKAVLEHALKLRPTHPGAALNLGLLYWKHDRLNGAEGAPTHGGAAINLAHLYRQHDRLDEAERTLLVARAANPSLASIDVALGSIYLRTGRTKEAIATIRSAVEKDGASVDAHSTLMFALNFDAELDPLASFEAHAHAGAEITAAAGTPFTAWDNAPDPDCKIKIGYVSGDFGQHPTGLFLRSVMEHHDRARFEVYCYSNRDLVDDVARILQRNAEHWEVVTQTDDEQLAGRIRGDAIDILVDLSGHTALNRLGVFARRPAPVQATWLGYLNTTGLPAMDYRICDSYTDPLGATERFHAEQLFRMPHSQWCYSPIYGEPVVQSPHTQRPESIVFGSFNQYAKISDACLDLWCRVLTSLPEATLVLLDVPSGRTQDALRSRLAHRNVHPGRVVIQGRKSTSEYFAAFANVDIALDTFPYNGATTTLDTLWMGVPVVAMLGDRGISRSSYSIMKSLGASDLIAADAEQYVDLNVQLARDFSRRRELRRALRGRLEASPLMDAIAFVRDLEGGYRKMWGAWCEAGRELAKERKSL